MKKFTFVLLGLCLIIQYANAQSIEIGQYSAKISAQGGTIMCQSFLHPGGNIASITAPVFAKYDSLGHPATFYILSGDGPNGPVLFQSFVNVPCLGKWFPNSLLSTLTGTQMEPLWVQIQDSINGGIYGLNELGTAFPINQSFYPGTLTFKVSLDTNVSNGDARTIMAFTNCHHQGTCYPGSPIGPWEPNNYPDGSFYYGTNGPVNFIFPDADMAFRVTVVTSTGIKEIPFLIRDNVLEIPEQCRGGEIVIADCLGRTLYSRINLKGGESVSIPNNQPVFLSLVDREGNRSTKKYISVK